MMWFSRRGRGGSSRCPTEIIFESHDKHGLISGPRVCMVRIFDPFFRSVTDCYHYEIRTMKRDEKFRTKNADQVLKLNRPEFSLRYSLSWFQGHLRSIPEIFVLLTPWCLNGKMCANWLSIFESLYSNNFKFIL